MHSLIHPLTSLPRSALVLLATYITGLVSWALVYRRER